MEQIHATLSAEVSILCHVASALGIGQKEFNGVNRMLLWRSAQGKTKDLDKLSQVHAVALEAVLSYFRRDGRAGSGGANEFADSMIMHALSLYPRACRALCGDAAPNALERRILIDDVLVPTAFALMRISSPSGAGRMISGLGNEFAGPSCWYAPDDGLAFHAVFERWLRVTGFRSPCGFSKDSASMSEQGKRWLSGKRLPTIESIDLMVDRFDERVDWLDEPSAWQARLRLARAVQYFWKQEVRASKQAGHPPPATIKALLCAIEKERVLSDPDEWLANPEIFFAVRLIQQRLKREGNWKRATQPRVTLIERQFSRRVSDVTIARLQAKDSRRLAPGHHLVRYLARRGKIHLGPAFDPLPDRLRATFEARVVEMGFKELRKLGVERRLAQRASRLRDRSR